VADEAPVFRDYRCLECGGAFTVEDIGEGLAPGSSIACPACGSTRTREHWESRVRNAPKTTPERFEELRDRPG
jgi:DNA-directed RNA polymerase subunit RPC12/RpoP